MLVYSGDLDPAGVTDRLDLLPTSYVRKGETVTTSHGRSRTGTLNGWFLSSEGQVASLDLRRHLTWLLDTLAPSRDVLMALQQEPNVRMAVNCVWWSATGGGGPVLWPEQMAELASLNLECSFDFAYYGDDDADEGGE